MMITQHSPFVQASKEDKYYKMIYNEDFDQFWEVHSTYSGKQMEFSECFKDFFISMSRWIISERLDLDQIKNHPWYNGPTATQEEVCQKLVTFIPRKNSNQESTKTIKFDDASTEDPEPIIKTYLKHNTSSPAQYEHLDKEKPIRKASRKLQIFTGQC